jgi:putative transposase
MISYIDEHREEHGVEPMCQTLTEAGMAIAPSTYYASKKRPLSARSQRDAELAEKIAELHKDNHGVYGVRKMWHLLRQSGQEVARCTVARLMRKLGLQGAVRGKKHFTTLPALDSRRAPDLVDRKFRATAPDQIWVADFTYVTTYSGMVYVAFVVDVFARRIVGWKADTTMRTELVLDALEMALWSRRRSGRRVRGGLIHHSDQGRQYTSIAFTERLLEAGIDASVGSVGDAFDNALAESTIGLYKAELIRRRSSWRGFEQVEYETMKWIDWYNERRLHSACDYRSPAAYEDVYYARLEPVSEYATAAEDLSA